MFNFYQSCNKGCSLSEVKNELMTPVGTKIFLNMEVFSVASGFVERSSTVYYYSFVLACSIEHHNKLKIGLPKFRN